MKKVALNHNIKVGQKDLNLYYYENNFWLTLNTISELFNCNANTIFTILKQLEQTSKINLKKFNKHILITLKNGKTTTGNFFSFEILMAIAYRLNPQKALQLHKLSLSSYQKILSKPTIQKRSFINRLRGV